jgi:DNA-directed RNA polymerase specialized sigma24 family protein
VEASGAGVTEEAFAALVDRWYASTVRLARLLARDDATARRAARDAWLRVIADGDEVTHLAVLRATVESAAVHVAARAAEPVVDPERFEADGHRWAGWWTDAGTPQDRGGAATDHEVTRVLAGLDPASAVVVTLRDVERLSPEEVQRVLDITPSDQRGFLAQGRAQVWEALG